ncbi:MAG: hypothetical protein GQ523_03975 [Methanophagales archaeon]|nr:hypothetical protein [Methanophagales archaeon]
MGWVTKHRRSLLYPLSNESTRYTLKMLLGDKLQDCSITEKAFSRFVRLALCVGIEVVFIAPSKPWMYGTIEESNKGFDKRFWQKELFIDLKDIRRKSKTFFETENKFYL